MSFKLAVRTMVELNKQTMSQKYCKKHKYSYKANNEKKRF